MFHGHPVERLCTYQYSLTSLIPGLLLALEDCGAPQLAEREKTLKRATEFKSSDRQSLLKFMGLPLDLFGKVSICGKRGGGGLGKLMREWLTGCRARSSSRICRCSRLT